MSNKKAGTLAICIGGGVFAVCCFILKCTELQPRWLFGAISCASMAVMGLGGVWRRRGRAGEGKGRKSAVIDAPKKSRSLTGFYIATGVVFALFVAGWLAWTPLRIVYWERKVRLAHDNRDNREMTDAAHELGCLGPGARAAFDRLLLAADADRELQISTISGLSVPGSTWALPLVVRTARHGKDRVVLMACIAAAEIITNGEFKRSFNSDVGITRGIEQARDNLLTWWEREGRAEYEKGR